MRIALQSDLHWEAWEAEGFPVVPSNPQTAADLLILAGDIHQGDAVAEVLIRYQAAYGCPLIHVPGNHEYWGTTLDRFDAQLTADLADHPDIHCLNNQVRIIDGVRFICSTLWTDIDLSGSRPEARQLATTYMQDLDQVHITGCASALEKVDFLLARHHECRRFLAVALAEPFSGPTVVVTHHAPSLRCVRPDHRAAGYETFFGTDLSTLVRQHDIALWVAGHTHCNVDFRLHDTRIVTNCRGNPGKRVERPFQPDLRLVV